MKKLVALAVAGAFVAPVYAAELSVSGDIELRSTHQRADGGGSRHGDSDIRKLQRKKSWPMELSVHCVWWSSLQDAALRLAVISKSSHCWSLLAPAKLGKVDHAVNTIDENADFGPVNGNDAAPSISNSQDASSVVLYTLPTLVPGLTLAGSVDGQQHKRQQSESIGLRYTVAGFTVAYGTLAGTSTVATTKYTGIAYSNSGLTVGIDSSTDDDVVGQDTQTIGLKYVMGDITFCLRRRTNQQLRVTSELRWMLWPQLTL